MKRNPEKVTIVDKSVIPGPQIPGRKVRFEGSFFADSYHNAEAVFDAARRNIGTLLALRQEHPVGSQQRADLEVKLLAERIALDNANKLRITEINDAMEFGQPVRTARRRTPLEDIFAQPGFQPVMTESPESLPNKGN